MQQVLRFGACLSNQFKLNTVSLIHEQKQGEGPPSNICCPRGEGLVLQVSESSIGLETLTNFPRCVLKYHVVHVWLQQAA